MKIYGCSALSLCLLSCLAVCGAGMDLQREIDAAAERGGGIVRVAAGEREVRPFVLKSNVTLELADGAVLLASTNIADYAVALGERCFVGAEGATNIAIVGRGVIDGRARCSAR